MISDLQARQIAASWHGGQWTALYAFTSSGAITIYDCGNEITSCLFENSNKRQGKMLKQLNEYITKYGPRGPQKNWDKLHW